eukprot:CAMPEP_0202891910 /NCGR_PEP_ID=MMETSP1392-20130828/1830_1 /ASSEMBLY_ACC=CAM_ASM_000868 /TAXON_ID=225041 /ORGANISM="Chlamydomonas chlamydogama, Strain SAG 11-48b" /LENGTH=179 /DNA_ID=CAMNT_0049575777 /DNA_START=107 /DNA_END=646 /DNA_ORIENTATION=+
MTSCHISVALCEAVSSLSAVVVYQHPECLRTQAPRHVQWVCVRLDRSLLLGCVCCSVLLPRRLHSVTWNKPYERIRVPAGGAVAGQRDACVHVALWQGGCMSAVCVAGSMNVWPERVKQLHTGMHSLAECRLNVAVSFSVGTLAWILARCMRGSSQVINTPAAGHGVMAELKTVGTQTD